MTLPYVSLLHRMGKATSRLAAAGRMLIAGVVSCITHEQTFYRGIPALRWSLVLHLLCNTRALGYDASLQPLVTCERGGMTKEQSNGWCWYLTGA